MFQIFHHRHDSYIVCALGPAGVMPQFLHDDAWEYGGAATTLRWLRPGFEPRVSALIAHIGFAVYLRQ